MTCRRGCRTASFRPDRHLPFAGTASERNDAPPGGTFNYTYTASAISPDGRQIVFRVATASEAPGLWLRPLDTLEGRRLAGTDGADFPFWSPDDRSVAFFSAGKLKPR